jgi:predicted RNA-binding protein with PUA-like domain/5'-deoxynucleotidase YfbR-like HD superfamily hydrolase
MVLTDKIKYALDRATELHEGQKRIGSGLPYIVHPYSVASILSEYTGDEDVLAAALLHDVLEDVSGYTAEDMELEFGPKVTSIVLEVTEEKDPEAGEEELRATWEKRKEGYLSSLRTASQEALMVAAADKIHNLWSILDEYEQWGDDLWGQFRTPSDKKLWFFEEVLKVLQERLKNPIVQEFEALYVEARNLFRKHQPEVESVPLSGLSHVLAEEIQRKWKPVKYWLMKTEPDVFSIDDLARTKKTAWEGVRNYQARNFMRDKMKPGDLILFYHSNAKPSGIAGIAKVVGEAYPDHTAWNKKSPYYDPKSSPEDPTWYMVDVAFVKKFETLIPLEDLKRRKDLKNMRVVQNGSRLSVQSVNKSHFRIIERMAAKDS